VAFTQKRSQTIEEYNDVKLTSLKQELPDESYIYGLDFFSDMRLAHSNTLSFGVHLKSEDLVEETQPVSGSYTREEASAYTISFAVEDTMRFGSFAIVPGIAYNSRKLYDVESSDGRTGGGTWKDTIDPMIGLSNTFSDGTRVYSSLAQKTTFPSISSTWNTTSAEVYDLDPETDVIFTFGATRTFFDKLDMGLAVFHHDIDDKIIRDSNRIPSNAGTLRLYGYEAVVSYAFSSRLVAGVDYSITRGDGSTVPETEYGDTLDRKLFGFKTRYRIPYIETYFSAYARNTVDNYDDYGGGKSPRDDRETFDMDLSLSKRFANNLELIARVKNLFDNNIEYEKGQPLEGRTYRLSVGYYF
jgi:outer membrane receptor for ferrienterochelin and colicin